MGLRAIAGLAALSGAVVFAGWNAIGHFADAVPDAEMPAAAVETTDLRTDRAPVMPIADAAIFDPSLLDPQPMLPIVQPVQMAFLAAPEPARIPAPEFTGALPRAAFSAPELKKIVVPKLDKNSGLTPAHIAQIRANLRLTPDQERYWEPIEAELRELARQMAAQKAQGKKPALTADAAQRLYWAAGPLIMSLRDDQKQEARRLARAMGLEQVAALL